MPDTASRSRLFEDGYAVVEDVLDGPSLAGLLPDYAGTAAPQAWNRTPAGLT